jgi:cation transporter-like permease
MKNLFRKLNLKMLVQLLVKNTLTQITVLSVITVISALISNVYEPAYYVMLTSIILLTIIALVFILFAWVINPIKEFLNKKNKK